MNMPSRNFMTMMSVIRGMDMNKLYTLLMVSFLAASNVSAKTFVVTSGKWTDAAVWNQAYPGNVIAADDEVIISGQVTMNTGIVVEGTLTVEKGASMVGMKDLMISKSGKFVNNGNTVMKRIMNEGTIDNNLIMESMMDIDNKGMIGNNNNMVAGNNFSNYGGKAEGKTGAYFVNNNVFNSPSSEFSKETKVFYGSQFEESSVASPFRVQTNLAGGVVELQIFSPSNEDVSFYSIERSTDGKTYVVLEILPVKNSVEEKTTSYTDTNPNLSLNHYRITATNSLGQQNTLPLTTVILGDRGALTFAGK
ncbi:MAG: hypothetical protein IPP77_02540 [Bacteroidetes bacterium]|nr:hypothetical protein [Bacteroidota bacterium]